MTALFVVLTAPCLHFCLSVKMCFDRHMGRTETFGLADKTGRRYRKRQKAQTGAGEK